jgi:hypothetical protein
MHCARHKKIINCPVNKTGHQPTSGQHDGIDTIPGSGSQNPGQWPTDANTCLPALIATVFSVSVVLDLEFMT